MTASNPPKVDCDSITPGLMVTDVIKAANFYVEKLGFTLGFTFGEPPTMAGVNLGNVGVHLFEGTAMPNGPAAYFVVGDADELYDFHVANGIDVTTPPGDRPYGLRDYQVRDLNGYMLGFGHYIPSSEPALPIERVDVPLRLEKRLAALLNDLAEHKRMSVDNCIEEMVLHTFEPEGAGVHSPHTMRTQSYIAELKQKHGIDYDTHASYRFKET